MTPLFVAAVISGLSGTPHCLAMCGGFAASCDGPRLLWWHLGRLATYGILGTVAALIGGHLPGPGWVPAAVSIAVIVWFAAALAGLAPEPKVRWPFQGWLVRKGAENGSWVPSLALGVANGLLPCGLVYSALALPVASGQPVVGGLLMVAFGLGTVPGLSVLAKTLQAWTQGVVWRRWVVAGIVLMGGLWSVLLRYSMTMGAGMPMSHP